MDKRESDLFRYQKSVIMVSKTFRLLLGCLVILSIIFCEITVMDALSTNESGVTTTVRTPPPTPPTFTFRTFETIYETHLYNPGIVDMEFYMKTQKNVIDYLAGFKNEFQRNVVETQMKFCPYETLCNFTVNANTDKRSCCKPCLCKNCEIERTCCPSVLDEKEFVVDNSTGQLYTENNTLRFLTAGKLEPTCTLRHLTIRPSYVQEGFMAVSECPINSDRMLRYNCSRPYTKDLKIGSSLPVFSNKSLMIFRNKFCAICNGVDEEDIVFFHPVVSCEKRDLLTQATSEKEITELIFANETCDLSFGFFDSRVRLQECKHSISRCNVTGYWKEYDIYQEIACGLYESKFEHENYVFHNVFCALCNGMSLHTVTCEWYHVLQTDIFTFSGLLNLEFDQGFSTAYLEENPLNQESSCKSHQIFDALTNRCKDIYCPEMRVLRNKHCINMYKGIQDLYSYILYIRIKPSTIITVGDAFGNETNWLLDIGKVFQANFSNLGLCDAQIAFKLDMKFGKGTVQALSQSPLLYADARICMAQSSNEPWTVADDLLNLHGTTVNFIRDSNKSVEYSVYVIDEDARLFKIIKRLLGNDGFHGKILSSDTFEKRIAIMSEYAMSDTDGLTILPYSVSYPINNECGQISADTEIDVIRFSSCPKVNVSKLDIPWTQNIDGLIIKDLKIPSNKFYHIDHLHIMTCVETFLKIVQHLQPKRTLNVEVIVSIACSSLSILSLLITLVVFSVLRKLRASLPGKNNMSLAAYLLIAQVLLLVGSISPFEQYSSPCKTVGVLIHYCWLCAIFWMNVCTYHMFRVLSQTKTLVTGHGLKQFIFYHIYVCIMSVLFVLANVISSLFISGNIGYGGKFCYIISEEKILFTFAFPTIVIVAVNLSMFLYVIIQIKRAPTIRRNVQNEHNELVIFAKLSTITGITWIFGFIYIWSGIQALSYIFTILNAGQGVFIMFAFVFNRKVLLLFKGRSWTWRKSRSKTSDNGSGTASSKL